MELEQVHELVELYFDGKTSLAEEYELIAYFSQAKVDFSLAHYAPYFTSISEQRKQHSTKKFIPHRSGKRINWKYVSVIAASFVSGFFVLQQTVFFNQPSPEEIAFEEFKSNMYLVSSQLNKGKQGVAYMETFNQTTEKYLNTK